MSGSNTTKLSSISDATFVVLECRELGHGWVHTNDSNVLADSRGNIIEFTRSDGCFRCHAERVQVFEVPSFIILKTKIVYPDGYLTVKGLRISRREAKREAFERLYSHHPRRRTS